MRQARIDLRLTPEERAEIERRAQAAQMSLSAWLIHAGTHCDPGSPLSEAERAVRERMAELDAAVMRLRALGG